MASYTVMVAPKNAENNSYKPMIAGAIVAIAGSIGPSGVGQRSPIPGPAPVGELESTAESGSIPSSSLDAIIDKNTKTTKELVKQGVDFNNPDSIYDNAEKIAKAGYITDHVKKVDYLGQHVLGQYHSDQKRPMVIKGLPKHVEDATAMHEVMHQNVDMANRYSGWFGKKLSQSEYLTDLRAAAASGHESLAHRYGGHRSEEGRKIIATAQKAQKAMQFSNTQYLTDLSNIAKAYQPSKSLDYIAQTYDPIPISLYQPKTKAA